MSVHDGDTLRAIDASKVEHKIRLHGIDAPEIGQAFGNVSRDGLTALIKGKAVEVHVEDRDRYGRTVARLEIDGLDVCRQMVADGLAWHFTRYSDDERLAAAEREARAARRGLWRDPAPMPPWEWRASEAERKREAGGAVMTRVDPQTLGAIAAICSVVGRVNASPSPASPHSRRHSAPVVPASNRCLRTTP